VWLAPIVVTPTRIEQSSFDLPVSIDAFNKEQIQQGQVQVNLSETLIRAPGIIVNTRHNYAQDLQISIRGFGTRSTFGIRRNSARGNSMNLPAPTTFLTNNDMGSVIVNASNGQYYEPAPGTSYTVGVSASYQF
jgi:outer membrane receptor protein involved in Fe transport